MLRRIRNWLSAWLDRRIEEARPPRADVGHGEDCDCLKCESSRREAATW
jgi:hypothetical protein